MAKVIVQRMLGLKRVRSLADVPFTPPYRRHQLKGFRNRQFAIDLIHPYRLVFEVNHEPVPYKADGGIDMESVTAIRIIEITDYH